MGQQDKWLNLEPAMRTLFSIFLMFQALALAQVPFTIGDIAMLGNAMSSTTGSSETLPFPTNALTYPLPLTVTKSGASYSINLSARDFATNTTVATFFLSKTGSDANDGRSFTNAKATWTNLVECVRTSQVESATIYIGAGAYKDNTGWLTNNPLMIRCTNGVATLGSLVGSDYVSLGGGVYGIPSPTIYGAWDYYNADSNGSPVKLVSATYANMISTEGTTVNTGGSNFVHLIGGRAADSNVITSVSTTDGVRITNCNVYMENIRVAGTSLEGLVWRSASSNWFVAYNCSFDFNQGNGLSTVNNSGFVFLENCRADRNRDDGLNYHFISSTTVMVILEYNCSAIGNGDGLTDNGSTIHNALDAIRVNGTYVQNYYANVHDVNNGFSWNINCTAGNSQATETNNIAFKSSLTGSTDFKMFLYDPHYASGTVVSNEGTVFIWNGSSYAAP